MRLDIRRLAGAGLFLVLAAQSAPAQNAPPAWIVPAGDKVIVVLRQAAAAGGFAVYRRGPEDREFQLLTPQPIRAVADPLQAQDLMGSDYDWVARRVRAFDPDTVWRRLQAQPNLAAVLSFVSNGLRMALGRTFIDLAATPGRSYRYRIVFLDPAGAEVSRYERMVRVTPAQRPAAPGKVVATSGEEAVNLTWSYPPYRGGDRDMTVGFVVDRRQEGQEPVRLTPAPLLRVEGYLSFQDSSAEKGHTYRYEVRAVDVIGEASDPALSAPLAFADRTPPLVPQDVTAADTDEGVLVLWRLSPDLDADHYDVYRGASSQGEFEKINGEPIPVERPRYLDRQPVRGKPWFYKVRAVDRAGNASDLSAAAVVIPRDDEPPGAVQGLEASAGLRDRSVKLAWKPVQEADLAGYFVYRGASVGDLLRLGGRPLPPDQTGFTDSGFQGRGLTPGSTLVYAVSAVDGSGNEGRKSTVRVQVPDDRPPPAPLGLAARLTPEGHVQLSWQPPLSRDLKSQRIFRRTEREFQQAAEVEAGQAAWLDRDAQRGRPVTYRLTAVDASGNESPPSEEVTVVPTDVVPPAAPEVAFELTPRGVTLRWSPPPDTDVAGYRLYRAPYAGAPWKLLTERMAKETTFFRGGGRAGERYGVAAVDTSGNEGEKGVVDVAE